LHLLHLDMSICLTANDPCMITWNADPPQRVLRADVDVGVP
jgi:hypothetical protein